jgi:hypothetical protein
MPTAAPLEFLPPRLDGRVVAANRLLLPLWLRLRSRIGTIEVRQVEQLAEETERRLWHMRVVEQRLEGEEGNSP